MTETKRVLIIEDDPDALDTLKENISTLSVDVDTASTKKEALEKVRRKAYHLAIVDVNLTDHAGAGSDRGGLDVVKKINSLREGTPCIILSGERSAEIPVDAHEIGINKYIIKTRVRTPDDYLDIAKKLSSECRLRTTGRFDQLNVYLARPEQPPMWDAQMMSIVKGGSETLYRLLSEAFGPHLPVLRRKDALYSLNINSARTEAAGAFWSRALGMPIWISIGRKGTSLEQPESSLGKTELIARRQKGDSNFAIWSVAGLTRDDFLETTQDVE